MDFLPGVVNRERMTHWRRFGLFVILTLAFSWLVWSPLVAGAVPPALTVPLIMVGGFGPLVGAVVTVWLGDGSVVTWIRSNLRFRLPLQWYALAVALPLGLILAAGVVYLAVADVALADLPAVWLFPLGLALTFFVGGGQEELGWRGFAQPALQDGLSALPASLLVGLVWFVWHGPLFFVPGSSQAGVPVVPYLLGVLATAVVLAWLYNATGSVLVPWLYHASVNPAGAYFLGGAAGLRSVVGYGIYALVVAAVAVALVVAYGPRDLAPDGRTRLSDYW